MMKQSRGAIEGIRETFRNERGAIFEWNVPRFFSIPKSAGDYYSSSSLSILKTRFWLNIYPNGDGSTQEWIFLQLQRMSAGKLVRFSLGIRKADGSEEKIHSDKRFPGNQKYVIERFLKRSELLNRKSQLAPADELTIICTVWSDEPPSPGGSKRSFQELQVLHPTDCNKVVEKRARLSIKDVTTLQKHLKGLLSGDDHDVVIKVKDREYKAHKIMLRARSPVFSAMFKHKMKESIDDSVTVEDCDPEVFGEFLKYVYTGEVENLSPSNAVGLYYAGDKYDISGLKELCVEYLKSSLSTTDICSVFALATKHREDDLLQCATSFFTEYLEEILVTVEWQRFLKYNSTQANELYIKAVQVIKKK